MEAAPRHISDKDEYILLAAVEKYGTLRGRALMVSALYMGPRAGELVGTQRSGAVRVHEKRHKYREVPPNPTARETVREYEGELKGTREEQPRLFANRRGRHIGARQFGEIVNGYARLAKVEDVGPHDLRHRFGYRMTEGSRCTGWRS